MPINDISSIFSQNTTAAKKKLEEIEANRPGAYQSNWQGTINSLMDKIVNQKDFSYDFNADPLYQQYKDQYTQLGKQAAMDTQANAATLTGGFGNSYAATAATQANQQYLTQLNNVIPQLYSLAMDKYQMDTDKLYNQFSAVGSQEDREYGQYRDTVTDWKDDRGYYYNKYNDSIGNDQFIANYNQSEDQFNQNMAYNRERDAIADSQWQQQLNITKAGIMYRIRSGSSRLITSSREIMYQIHSGKSSMRCHLLSQRVLEAVHPEEVHPEANQVVQAKLEKV